MRQQAETLDEVAAVIDGAGQTRTRMRTRINDLYPILRSITGPGLRDTLTHIRAELPDLVIHEVPSGTKVFDWTVPLEWSVREAYLTDPHGRRVADVTRHNLMLVNYSVPFKGHIPLSELRTHLHSLPGLPNAIPYRTSYYEPSWGFCLPHRELESLPDGDYEVMIDTSLEPGSLSYGELYLPGENESEVLLSAHVCHPSLANDNLSAVAVLVELARFLAQSPGRYSYRLLFAPGTIGALAFLARTPASREHVRYGLVLAGLGDSGPLHYKRTRNDADIDRVVLHVLRGLADHAALDFDPFGYDERQYSSPGIDMPVGRLGRTPPGTYPEYHSSEDHPDFVKDEALLEALQSLERIVFVIEHDGLYLNQVAQGEPQLGRRGLYRASDSAEARAGVLWLLSLSDGSNSLLDVAERSGLEFEVIKDVCDRLVAEGLLAPQEEI